MNDDMKEYNPSEELDEWITPTPLSDPVLTAIFRNMEVSGFAMRSFLNATFEDSGDTPVSEVVTVTPHSIHSETISRGFRIDVETRTIGESLHWWKSKQGCAVCISGEKNAKNRLRFEIDERMV